MYQVSIKFCSITFELCSMVWRLQKITSKFRGEKKSDICWHLVINDPMLFQNTFPIIMGCFLQSLVTYMYLGWCSRNNLWEAQGTLEGPYLLLVLGVHQAPPRRASSGCLGRGNSRSLLRFLPLRPSPGKRGRQCSESLL